MQKNKAWRYIDVSSIVVKLGDRVCQGLVGMHAFSGCDSTSRFSGKGKTTVMNLLTGNEEFCDAMISLGVNFEPDINTMEKAEKAVCHMYNASHCKDTNQVRCHKWNRLTTDITKLPPCHDSTVLHIRRVNYQVAIWKRCLDNDTGAPSPHGHGWVVLGSDISILWMSKPRAPKQVLETMKCTCKADIPCTRRQCSCKKRKDLCTIMCLCNDECCNVTKPRSADSDDSDME